MHEQLYRQAQRLYVHLQMQRDATPRYTLRWLRLDLATEHACHRLTRRLIARMEVRRHTLPRLTDAEHRAAVGIPLEET